MADDKPGAFSTVADILKTYGLGGFLLIGGFALIGLTIYEDPSIADPVTQKEVLLTGLVSGALAIVIGGLLLWKGQPSLSSGLSNPNASIDIFIAAPMAGFRNSETERDTMNDFVRKVEASLKRQGVANVHTPILSLPDSKLYEDPAVGLEVELAALRNSKRYLLILPEKIPALTSVLITTGIAIALNLPSVIFAKNGADLPYLLEGAVNDKKVNVQLRHYEDIKDVEQLIAINGLRLFTP